MKPLGAIGFVALMMAVAVLYAWFRLGAEFPGVDSPKVVLLEETPKHRVTAVMAEASRKMMLKRAPDFRVRGSDGAEYRLSELIRKGPVLLTFTKIGCPCSEAAQPFFNRLAAAYPQARVLNVVDGDLGPANRWARKLQVSYPTLLDPELRLARDFGVENSAYVVLIDSSGRIAEHWPGYSKSMLQQLGNSLASMTGSPMNRLDTTDAPSELYTGCPYPL